jgi:uncharacterized OsmC-like protein
VESEDGVLVLRRVRVTSRLRICPDADRDKIRRAFEHHMPYCPVYRSIGAAVQITTALELLPE